MLNIFSSKKILNSLMFTTAEAKDLHSKLMEKYNPNIIKIRMNEFKWLCQDCYFEDIDKFPECPSNNVELRKKYGWCEAGYYFVEKECE